jgi:chaperonin GroES
MMVPEIGKQEKEQQVLMDANIDLMYDRVLVIPDDSEKKTKSGIIIPDTAQDKPRKGTVVAVGPDCYGTDDPEKKPRSPRIFKGARIVYGKYAGSEMKINGVEAVILRENDVLFIFPKSTNIEIEYK